MRADSTAILHLRIKIAIKELNSAEHKRASRLSDSAHHLCFAVIGIYTYKILRSINIASTLRDLNTTLWALRKETHSYNTFIP